MTDDTQGSLIPLPTPDLALAMDQPEAQERIARIQAALAVVLEDIIALYRGRAWIAMGYPSWDALCAAEFPGVRMPVPQRRDAVLELTEAGLSTRAIGAALGVSDGTVRNDQKSTAQDYAVDPRPVVGLDGRTRTYPPPEPAPDPVLLGEMQAAARCAYGLQGFLSERRRPLIKDYPWQWAQRMEPAIDADMIREAIEALNDMLASIEGNPS
jgi:hypothetical protein